MSICIAFLIEKEKSPDQNRSESTDVEVKDSMKRLSTNILDGKKASESGSYTKNEEESSVKKNMESFQEVSKEICECKHIDSNTVDEPLQWTIPQLITAFCRSDSNYKLPIQHEAEQSGPVVANSDDDLPGEKKSEACNKGCLAQSCPDVTNKNDVPIASTEGHSTHALIAGYPRECEEPHPGSVGIKDVVPLKQVVQDRHPITSNETPSTHALIAGYPRECEEPYPGCEGIKDVVPLKQVVEDRDPITSTETPSSHALIAGYPREREEPRPGSEGIKDVVPLKQVVQDRHPITSTETPSTEALSEEPCPRSEGIKNAVPLKQVFLDSHFPTVGVEKITRVAATEQNNYKDEENTDYQVNDTM